MFPGTPMNNLFEQVKHNLLFVKLSFYVFLFLSMFTIVRRPSRSSQLTSQFGRHEWLKRLSSKYLQTEDWNKLA